MVNSVERNVEAVLMGSKTFRRRPGDVPYPVENSGGSSSIFDIWDNMFYRACCRNLTMHQFDSPPAVVLDLGCGSGYWAIEAAKEWKSSTIVGYDVRNIQPRLFAFEEYKDVAHRVKWIHGNLLDGLPFSSGHFDFVRIVNIGLGVPEDEWQFVLEEVARVMKPGAVIEVIEEDPIFPCVQLPQRVPMIRPQPSPISIDLPPLETAPRSALSSKSSTTVFSDPWSATLDDRFELNSPKSTLTLNSLTPPASSAQSTYREHHPCPPHTIPVPSISEPDRPADPRDHSKLKAAWEAMLSSRFIASNPLSVLPFYLSSIFVDVQLRPPLKVPLPPNSSTDRAASRSSGAFSCDSAPLSEPARCSAAAGPSSASIRTSRSDPSPHPPGDDDPDFNTAWASMHLASTVHKAAGCKEAMWQEYQKLYDTEDMPRVTRTARPGEARAMSTRSGSSTRESFDEEWASWQNDMTDRIGMRAAITPQFGWPEPPGERPDWRVWRSMLAKVQLHEENHSLDSLPSPTTPTSSNLCRSLRGFVGWKP
ncbi:putative ubiE/COQ5 methyltransferase family protein [Lyophyllum shimeji]|uniref:UbiE/COQ5 methyltransferase family protein n=1 Tax=Lyophyllum shimeji TaxID=47721 RepID=A0A9P3UMD3_LYOSH|nr:putative ubiE/COQ5 methyltransferase family protein [Lyophyllum shimeji]